VRSAQIAVAVSPFRDLLLSNISIAANPRMTPQTAHTAPATTSEG